MHRGIRIGGLDRPGGGERGSAAAAALRADLQALKTSSTLLSNAGRYLHDVHDVNDMHDMHE